MSAFEPGVTKTDERVTVVGASGYIGKAVVRECVRRGYPTTAVVRDAAKAQKEPKFEGAQVKVADVCDAASLKVRRPRAAAPDLSRRARRTPPRWAASTPR